MSQLVLNIKGRELAYYLDKRMTTVGTERFHDIVIQASSPGVCFTLVQDAGTVTLIEGRTQIRVNGMRAKSQQILASCDRLEWEGNHAVFISSSSPPLRPDAPLEPLTLQFLHELTGTLHLSQDFHSAFHKLLEVLIATSEAEDGVILSESGDAEKWRVVASSSTEGTQKASKKELFSNSVLSEALAKRDIVYIENIIGNPFADALSIIEAKIFSAACVPLMMGDRVFGAILLHSRTPGRSIRRERLAELKILATQAALMLVSSAEIRKKELENEKLRSKLVKSENHGFVHQDPAMAAAVRTIERLAPTDIHVLVTGETGTGKEIAAREIHRLSKRKDGPFVAVNCAAIPGTLLESTLFGHEKGAFTGADRRQPGKFELAHGGTLFLDEIGDMPLELQAKLLRAVQEKTIEPLGSSHSIPVDVRIVAASHRGLTEMIQAKTFRQDLYYRLAGATVTLPPLRQRKQDIALLARHFLGKVGGEKALSEDAVSLLTRHSWPGNVRELEHAISRAALMSDGPELVPTDFQLETWPSTPLSDDGLWDVSDLNEAQRQFTLKAVNNALNRCLGNRVQAARSLGISERTLYRILAEPANSSGIV